MMGRVFAVLGAAAFAAAVASAAQEKAPDTYKVKFDTSKGPVVVEVHRAWAPTGADHLYNLVKSGFYNDVLLPRGAEFHGAVRYERRSQGAVGAQHDDQG